MRRDLLPDIAAELGAGFVDAEKYLAGQLAQMRANPLEHGYAPHPGQLAILMSRALRRIVVCANRWGKTVCGMRDSLWCARGQHPYRPVHPKPKRWWCATTNVPAYKNYTKPAFDEWCPPGWIEGSFNEVDRRVTIRRADGGTCEMFFPSYDQDPQSWAGAAVNGIWMDEEPPEKHFREALARLQDTRGSMLITLTPVEGIGWWYDDLFVPAREGRSHWAAFQAALATRDVTNVAEFEVGESLVPHFTREQIVSFAADFPDPDERDIRIFGRVKGRRGLVYKGFDKKLHVVETFDVPAEYDIWGALDPGYHGFAVVFGAISPDERVYIIDEVFSQQETIAERFKQIAAKVRGLRKADDWRDAWPTVVFFVDTEDPQVVLELNIQAAAFQAEQSRAGEEVVIQLSFASLDQGLKARKAGLLRVQQMLAPRKYRQTPKVVARPRPEGGEPQLYFLDSLHAEWQGKDRYHRASRVLWEIERYKWKEPHRGTTLKRDEADEHSADGAHAMAALRYLIMSRLGPVVSKAEQERRERPEIDDPVLRMVRDDFEATERYELEAVGEF